MTCWTVAEEVAFEAVGEEMVALRLKDGRYFELNETAAMIFRLLDGGCDDEEIIEIVAGEFEVDEETARADVQTLIASLLEHGLVTEGPS
jgi:methyltransferase-like protein